MLVIILLSRADQFSRGGGCCRALIGNQIGNGGIDFMADPSDDCNFAGEQGVLFDTNLIIDPDNSATGSITIMYTERVQ